jgi:hypothetical protein
MSQNNGATIFNYMTIKFEYDDGENINGNG